MKEILKRLEIIKSSIAIEDEEIIELQIMKLYKLEIDEDVKAIVVKLENRNYGSIIVDIENYISRFTGVVAYIDLEVQGLKLELKSLESKLRTLSEEKQEYLNEMDEFNKEYNIHLGAIIENILNLKREILYKKTIKQQKLKEKYQEDKQTFEESKESIDELKSTIEQLQEALENIDETDEQYQEIKNSYDELLEELEKLEYDLHSQEEKLNKSREQIEDETVFEEFKEAKKTYEEYNREYEQIKDENSVVLSEDEKKELKILWKNASKLCHPDIVADQFKEKATEIMQALNDAYSKKDINKIKEILHNLENGTTFEVASDNIENKEILKSKIEEFKSFIQKLQDEIEEIKSDDTFVAISELDDWNLYFEELKSELQKQEKELEEEAREILVEKEEIEEWIQNLWDWADEHQISSDKLSRKKVNLLKMTSIDFTGLKLTNIPTGLCNLQNINELVLWDNELTFLPDDIVRLSNLKKLNLRGNAKLYLSPIQMKWVKELQKNSVVFIDEIKLIPDKNKLVELIKQKVLTMFKTEHNVDLNNNPQIILRIYDESKKVADQLLTNAQCTFILNYVTYIKNQPVHINKLFSAQDFGLNNNKQIKKIETIKNEPTTVNHQTQSSKIIVIEERSVYITYIQSIENPNFEKIRRYCENLTKSNKSDEMQKYLAENGKMYKALIYSAMETFIERINGETITLVDWGCDQGICSILVLDYIKEKQLNIIVDQVLLTDSDATKLSRAIGQVKALDFHNAKIEAFKSDDIDISGTLKTIKNNTTLNLFANNKMSVDYLEIDFDLLKSAYFMCVSNENKEFVDEVYENIKSFKNSQDLSKIDGKIGKFSKFERLFKI